MTEPLRTLLPSGPERSRFEGSMQGQDVSAWCPGCRQQVSLINLRSWPEGVLVIGDCPSCQVAVASSRPVGWVANGSRAHVARTPGTE
jgi:hypothetical protein